MLVDARAYSLVLFLQETQRSFQEMLNHLKVINKEADEKELFDFLGMTIKQFIDFGVVGLKK